jgi:hypothetical protein
VPVGLVHEAVGAEELLAFPEAVAIVIVEGEKGGLVPAVDVMLLCGFSLLVLWRKRGSFNRIGMYLRLTGHVFRHPVGVCVDNWFLGVGAMGDGQARNGRTEEERSHDVARKEELIN